MAERQTIQWLKDRHTMAKRQTMQWLKDRQYNV